MTQHDDIERAAREAAESTRRSEQEMRRARKSADHTLSIARWLRGLREDNGFGPLLDDAFGGGRA